MLLVSLDIATYFSLDKRNTIRTDIPQINAHSIFFTCYSDEIYEVNSIQSFMLILVDYFAQFEARICQFMQ